MNCTNLDHVYPKSRFGQRCYCGKRTWGQKKVLDSTDSVGVELLNDSDHDANSGTNYVGKKTMTLTLKGTSKNGKQAIYTGAAQSVRFSVGTFADGNAPQTIEVPDGVFAEPKQPKQQLSAEEKAAQAAARKAERANRPKPTLAEKIAQREAALEKLRQKAAAENQPSM